MPKMWVAETYETLACFYWGWDKLDKGAAAVGLIPT